MKRITGLFAAVVLVVGACGGGDEDSPAASDTTSVPTTSSVAATTTLAPTTTEALTTAPSTTTTTTIGVTSTTTMSATTVGDTLSLPEDLVDRDAGANYFDPLTPVSQIDESWYLLKTDVGSTVHVPAGWTSVLNDRTTILFAEGGDAREHPYSIRTRVSTDLGYFGDYDSPAVEALVGSAEFFIGMFQADLTDVEVLDDTRGYIAGTFRFAELDSQGEGFACLYVYCGRDRDTVRFLAVKAQESEVEFHQFWAAAPASDWDHCYPVLRHMVHSWSDSDGNNLGLRLPQELSSESLSPDQIIDFLGI